MYCYVLLNNVIYNCGIPIYPEQDSKIVLSFTMEPGSFLLRHAFVYYCIITLQRNIHGILLAVPGFKILEYQLAYTT